MIQGCFLCFCTHFLTHCQQSKPKEGGLRLYEVGDQGREESVEPYIHTHTHTQFNLMLFPAAGNLVSKLISIINMSFTLCLQVRSVWLWLWRVVVRTSWSVGKLGQRGLWVTVGWLLGQCAAGPLPLAVVAVWWSGPLGGSARSTSFHWWSESETATERRDSDVLVGLQLLFFFQGSCRSEQNPANTLN